MTTKISCLVLLFLATFLLSTPARLAAQAQTEEQVYPGTEDLPALEEGAAPSSDGGVEVPEAEGPVTPVPEAQPQVTSEPPTKTEVLVVPGSEKEPAEVIVVETEEEVPEPKYGDKPFTFQTGGITWSPFLQARFRQETRLNTYGAAGEITDNQHFITTRVRFGMAAQWKFVRGMLQLQDVRLFGSRPGSDDSNSFALHQGILELGNERGYVRLGRQEINYGNQRMIGALDWLMSARSFDALRLHGSFGDKLELDVFASIVARQQMIIIDDTVEPIQVETNNGSYLGTANLSYKHSEALYLEAYALYRHDRPNDVNSLTVRNDIVSPGLYVTGVPTEGLKYTGEFTIQGGKQRNDAFFAFAVSGDVDYTFKAKTTPTLNAGFAYATGASGDGKVDEFNNFYPTNHKFYGAADLFGLRNIVDAHAHVAIKAPNAPVGLRLGFYNFALANPSARWSNAGGATFGLNPDNSKRNMGQEIDLILKWSFLPGVALAGGWTVFVPNQGADNLGNDEVSQWGFVMLAAQTP